MPSQIKLGALLESVPDALVGVDRAGVIRFVNRQTESMFGYEREDLIGTSIETLVPEAARRVHVAHRSGYNAAPRIRPMGSDLRVSGRRKDGTEFPVDIALSPMSTDERMLVIAAVRDMSSYRKEEGELLRLGRLASIVEHSDDAVISSTLDGIITSWNPAAERLYGYTSEEIVGSSGWVLLPEDQTEESRAALDKIRAGEHVERQHTHRVRKDGTMVPISLTASPIRDADGAVIGMSTTARDLTQQEEASELSRSMIEASLDSMVSISRDGKIIDVNEATVRLTGVPREELIGTDFSDYFTEPERANQGYQQALEQGSVTDFPLTLRHHDGDGTGTEVVYNASLYRDISGTIRGVFAAARDVTELKRAAEYARSLIEAALDPLVTISPDGKITDVNESTVKATGVPRDTLIGTDFSHYFTQPDRASEGYQQVLAQGSVRDLPLTLRHRDGRLTEVMYNASLYRDASGTVLGVFAVARDVTKQNEAQREAARQQARELERLAELERFQRLTVGRELRMIELKKEIEYLRKSAPAKGGEADDQR